MDTQGGRTQLENLGRRAGRHLTEEPAQEPREAIWLHP